MTQAAQYRVNNLIYCFCCCFDFFFLFPYKKYNNVFFNFKQIFIETTTLYHKNTALVKYLKHYLTINYPITVVSLLIYMLWAIPNIINVANNELPP